MSGLSQTLQTLIYPSFAIALLVLNRLVLGDNTTVAGVAYGIMAAGMLAFNHGAYQIPPK